MLDTETRVYPERWYILLVFSFMTMIQCAVWNTWGPIENVALASFPTWTDSTIGLLANWGNIAMYIMFIPCIYLVRRSLRAAVVLSAAIMAAGASIRCLVWFGISEPLFTVLCHIGAFLNAAAGIVLCSAPPALSAVWFPLQERVTATCIGQTFNGLGTFVSYLFATIFVKQKAANATDLTNIDVEEYRHEINNYLVVLAGCSVALLWFSLLYFPSKPPSPPSRSSEEERLSLKSGTMSVLTNTNFLLLLTGLSVANGTIGTYSSIMVTNLTKLDVNGKFISENWVGLVGIVGSVVSTGVSVCGAVLADRFQGRMKLMIISLLTLSGVLFTLLSLVTLQVIRVQDYLSLEILVFTLLVAASSLGQGIAPLALELAVEICYPASEIVVGGACFIGYGTISFLFLLVFSINGVGTDWLNYVLPLSVFSAIPLFLAVNERYPRLEMDLN